MAPAVTCRILPYYAILLPARLLLAPWSPQDICLHYPGFKQPKEVFESLTSSF